MIKIIIIIVVIIGLSLLCVYPFFYMLWICSCFLVDWLLLESAIVKVLVIPFGFSSDSLFSNAAHKERKLIAGDYIPKL
jgi:hypothetical protein